ncbi:MAG: YraN family protein [Pseudomonadota bacterium]|nr:YraN family protein [Pseudomonadota bacterium]NLX30236.1 YraN family protein [Deltaproteobacteria bacterium]HNU84690.1 YraN family protein [Syntrophales bacterium]HNZ33977.1 YraN family protein [Syntrophales bacterium]HOF73110.1 YraN family protein [Syntrophales bacterium]
MTRERKNKGARGEERAAEFLRDRGYRILERNYRCPLGEIDLIARDGGTVVFVEVKTRSTERFGSPQASIGARKQRRMTAVALYYLKGKNWLTAPARFDVAAVSLVEGKETVTLYRNAFDAAGV